MNNGTYYLRPISKRILQNTDIIVVNKEVADLIIDELHRRTARNFIVMARSDDLFVTIVCTEKLYPSARNELVEYSLGLIRGLALGKEVTK